MGLSRPWACLNYCQVYQSTLKKYTSFCLQHSACTVVMGKRIRNNNRGRNRKNRPFHFRKYIFCGAAFTDEITVSTCTRNYCLHRVQSLELAAARSPGVDYTLVTCIVIRLVRSLVTFAAVCRLETQQTPRHLQQHHQQRTARPRRTHLRLLKTWFST